MNLSIMSHIETINYDQMVDCVRQKDGTCWNVIGFHLNNLNKIPKGVCFAKIFKI